MYQAKNLSQPAIAALQIPSRHLQPESRNENLSLMSVYRFYRSYCT